MRTHAVHVTIALVSVVGTAGAFCPQQQQKQSTTALSAKNGNWRAPVAAAALGWALATQVAGATVGVPTNDRMATAGDVASSSVVLSAENLDFSLPSYDASLKNVGGFGDGTEAYLGKTSATLTDPGTGEAGKEKEAMKKAEEARQAKLAEKKAAMKMKEAEDKIRAQEKKLERDRRMKGIFD